MIAHQFVMLARYNAWANVRLYEAVRSMDEERYRHDAGAFFGSMHRTLNHVLVADRIWMNRFTGEGPTYDRLDAVPCGDLKTLSAEREREDARILFWVRSLDDEALGANFTYIPVTTPEPVTQRLAPALTHMFNHQTHHRGQAHMILTAQGSEAPALDLIYFHREAARAA